MPADEVPSTVPDPHMARLGEGLAAAQAGDREGARATFAELWAEIGGDDGPPLVRCGLAHSMADVQDDLEEEVAWDLRALAAADAVTDADVAAACMPGTAEALRPSLHLNLSDGYHRLGRPELAREHLDAGAAALPALPDDGYRDLIAGGLARLRRQLDG